MVRISRDFQVKFQAAGVEVPQVFYAVSHKSQYEGDVNVEFNTSTGTYHQRGENMADARRKFLNWYIELNQTRQSREARILANADTWMDYSATCDHCGAKNVTVNANAICKPCRDTGIISVTR